MLVLVSLRSLIVGQAIKTLSETKGPEDIPCVFIGPTKGPNSLFELSSPSLQPLVSTGPEMQNLLLPIQEFSSRSFEAIARSITQADGILETSRKAIKKYTPWMLLPPHFKAMSHVSATRKPSSGNACRNNIKVSSEVAF